jgi:phosphoglycolate phosphatase
MMAKPTLVFDLDGTLADTAPDLLSSLNHCLTLEGIEPVDGVMLKSYVGQGARVMLERAFVARRKPLPVDKLETLQAIFFEHYRSEMPGKTLLYPGVKRVMNEFAGKGYLLAICTNKLESMSVRLLEGLGVADQFASICGGDTFSYRKPDPRHLIDTITRAGGEADKAILIGDSRTDIDTAKAAGIPVIAVDFGYSDRHVREFEPSRIISHFDEITLDFVERLLRAAAANSTGKSR